MKEKPFDSEMRSKALGVCGKLQLFCFPFLCWRGGGGNNIYNVECGKTKTILFPILMLARDNNIYNVECGKTKTCFPFYAGEG